ncbi:hypothetical protein JVU11DRAFT_523 [Chiua virens]|nr:hypothetical protein JVU11DRAFT_523 [Chiua virens]
MHSHIQHPSPPHPSTAHHNYGTRIRKNSVLKPSARLRQCPPSPHPPPRRIKPVPTHPPHPVPPTSDPCFPLFPLPGVMLHPEDASNKVFHAIGRSFISVENRAMTIKDLAEMTLKYGLLCQNVSAASQAITTYIRNHMARCEAQQDHPLLLRHVLSGTLADDDLVPALYSRVGGATSPTKSSSRELGLNDKNMTQVSQPPLEGERHTNFRRGTMVWYLSKAAGVSCPFARAGIRLSEYGKEGRHVAEKRGSEPQSESKKHASHDEAQCGDKRKRLRRGCRWDSGASRESSSGRDSQSPAIEHGEVDVDASDDERPPKVKLTLRLRPSLSCVPTPPTTSRPREVIDLSNDTADSSSENDDTGAEDGDDLDMRTDTPEAPWSLPPYPRRSYFCPYGGITDERRRSPSVPWSASPPPDSDHDDLDFDLDSDVDWDSVPSPEPALQVKVEAADDLQPFKPDPADIRDMLDAWEDFDCAPTSTVSSATAKLPADDLRFDSLELWEWEFESDWTGGAEDQQDLPVVKMEPDEHKCLTSCRPFAPGVSLAPPSPSVASSHPSSSPISDVGVNSFSPHTPLSPFALPASPSPSTFPNGSNRGDCALTWQDAELLGPDSVHPHEFEGGWTSGAMHTDGDLFPRRASDEDASSFPVCVKPEAVKADVVCAVTKEAGNGHTESSDLPSHFSSVVVPDATILGSTLLLRRIDTDFVNLSTILSHLSLSHPLPLPDGCVNVSHASLAINGIWTPLNVARLYARGLPAGIESIFLSEDLVMRFPTALQDFYQKSASGRSLNQFGPDFHTSSPLRNPLNTPQGNQGKPAKDDIWEGSVETGLVEETLLAIPPSVNLALAALHPSTSTEVLALPEMPLSPTEQEIFRALCVHPDWETEEAGTASNEEKVDTTLKRGSPMEKPLRRSRRVADAAARSRVAPPRIRGPRHT